MMQPDIDGAAAQNAPSDETLVRQAQQGDVEAFTTLYERYLPAVYNRVRYIVPEEDAEDVTQEIFVAVMKSLKSFKGKALFSTWLRTLVNRRVADYYRRRSRRGIPVDADVSDVDPQAHPQLRAGTGAMSVEEKVLLRQALLALPEQYQEVLLLRFAEGLPFNEIALALDKSLEATKSSFRRAVAALRIELGESNG